MYIADRRGPNDRFSRKNRNIIKENMQKVIFGDQNKIARIKKEESAR